MTSEKMLELQNWAVVGVKPDKDQYAYMIYRRLKDNGYTVYPVNPGFDNIDDEKCYKTVNDIPDHIDVVDMVVNPRIGEMLIDGILKKGIKHMWLQPGSHDEQFMNKVRKIDVEYVKDCVMMRLRFRNKEK